MGKERMHMKKNRLLSLLQPKAKPVIITIHGYGRRRSHEMDNLAAWAKDERFTVIQFDLYDLFDEEDCDPKQWLARAEAVVKTHCAGKQPVKHKNDSDKHTDNFPYVFFIHNIIVI